MISIQGGNTLKVLRVGDYKALKKYLLQGVVMLACFILMAFPFLFIIVGKYHLHIINRVVFEYTMGIFHVGNYLELIRENISVSFLISIIGFIWFYKNFHQALIRRIILGWLFISILMYIYATVIPKIDHLLDIRLPGTVTSYHYFFYLKALQSVFFGFGFVFIIKRPFQWIENFIDNRIRGTGRIIHGSNFFIITVLLCAIIYFPYYRSRRDFVEFREWALIKAHNKDKVQVYNYILKNVPPDKVILCESESSIFPVMATGRKMVSINATFSNPYVSYEKRESDRNNMLLYLKTSQPDIDGKLFCDYQVSFALLSNKELRNYKVLSPRLGQIVFKNSAYTIFALKK